MSLSKPINRRQAGAFMAALSAAAVGACGGGSTTPMSTQGSATAATAYTAGPITGFGSVIVNGVRFDDSLAQVLDDEDRVRTRDQLRLGMMVEVDAAGVDRGMGVGRATRIRFGSAIVGPVEAIDAAAASLRVLGQVVVVTETTVFDEDIVGGLPGLAADDVVEVHAQYDAAAARFRATRIERAALAATYKLRGVVAQLDAASRTFSIGDAVISYAGVADADLPPGLADGMTVRVRLQTAVGTDGHWVAVSVRPGVRRVDDHPDAQLRGIVTAFTSSAAFAVNGLAVDAGAALFPDGTAGIALGARVEVLGAIRDGVLVASRVELEERHMAVRHRFELHGLVEGLDTTAKTFTLRGVTVWYGGSVSWKDGAESDLANGRRVEVRGVAAADRTRIEALEIAFE